MVSSWYSFGATIDITAMKSVWDDCPLDPTSIKVRKPRVSMIKDAAWQKLPYGDMVGEKESKRQEHWKGQAFEGRS